MPYLLQKMRATSAMSDEEHASPATLTLVSFRKGGHPTGGEMVLGGLLMLVGFITFYTWVATFDAIWAIGIAPFSLGAILIFHSDPILETLQKWKRTRPGASSSSRKSRPSTEGH